ncbi:MAG: rhodanese-like domain-containing protein, partial [Clostridiales bacterium]|nr:rhodanese-like domain-containing protein [Clostridiales bacterium]
FVLVIAVISVIFVAGCKDDVTDPDVNEFDVLKTYMTDSGFDLANIAAGWVMPGTIVADGAAPTEVDSFAVSYEVIDLRSAEDFAAGHIKDAINSTLGDILTTAGGTRSPIMVVCYTGQTAARAVTALRLSGYADAISLKWGMCGWNAEFDFKWEDNAATETLDGWVTEGEPTAVAEFNYPTLSTGETDGADILAARVDDILSLEWTQGNADVLATPDNYFINNYWSEDSWNTYGHIPGAYRINETLGLDGLVNLDPEAETMITYCYTGQTSALITGWLHILGYENAKSLVYGANGIVADGTVPAKSWHGEGSASELNFGYFQTVDGEEVYVGPTL